MSSVTISHHDSVEERGVDVLVLQVVSKSLVSSDAQCSRRDLP